jgi:DNA-binding LacI/PurR family transcriptional regulator
LGHFAGSSISTTGRLRKLGFERAVSDVEGAACVTLFSEEFQPDEALAMKLLQSDPRPTAIFAANDNLAESLYHAAGKLGMRIPEDLSIVGFSDLFFSSYLSPPLTTIHHFPKEIGRAAAKQILSRSQDNNGETQPWKTRLTPKLIVRQSTMPPAPRA